MPSEKHESAVQIMAAQFATMQQAAGIAEVRASFERFASRFPLAGTVKTERAAAGGVPGAWVTAEGARQDRAVLYLHGGGYAIGSIATHQELASRVSRAARARVLIVEYRLSPEHPYPAALEDALRAYRWLLASGSSPQRLAIAGDSAGGGLTLATLMALRDAGEPLPAAAVCMSPWIDLEATGDSARRGAVDDPVLHVEALREWGRSYAGTAGVRDPGAAPLYGSFARLPPLLVQVGTREILLDDSLRLIAKARAEGADVTAEVEDGLMHVWQLFPSLPEAEKSLQSIGVFLQEHWPR
jgi:monoterpene epsilon-lactone hydrolase